jgi:prephenate dehydrogenase
LFATVSHLPHLLAFAFITHILKTDDAERRFAFAGSGFRDFSRIAASSPEMWRDICTANRDAILADMDGFLVQVGQLRQAIADGDAAALESVFALARDARSDWHQGETLAARALRHSAPGTVAKPSADFADPVQGVADGTSGPLVPKVNH